MVASVRSAKMIICRLMKIYRGIDNLANVKVGTERFPSLII